MKLSIITVNLNNRDGLQKTIDSVVSQTFRDFEWIVIDGGSTDGSKELIEKYADHFAYWVSEPDKGIYNAMNKGIKMAKGEYLQFLNSGDWLDDKDTLNKVLSHNYSEDILFGTCFVHDPNTGTYLNGPTHEDVSAFELLSKSLPHQASFIRNELFNIFGPYDETFRICADMKFFFNTIIINNATIRYLGMAISHFDGDGISNQHPEIVQQETERIALEYFPKRLLYDFWKYNEVLQNYCVVKACQHQGEENKRAIRLYNTMNRYTITKAMVTLLLKYLNFYKRHQSS